MCVCARHMRADRGTVPHAHTLRVCARHPPARPDQDFITGPANAATFGYFGVDHVTGEGYAIAADAWADSPEEPAGGHCIDSWTGAPVAVPVGGLTAYPGAAQRAPDYAAATVVSPAAMLTLGNTSGASVAQKYDDAYAALGVPAAGGQYGDGMFNSDPLLMLQSGSPGNVSVAVRALAANAKVLGTLSLARALYECREGKGARLSNELFVQVGTPPSSACGPPCHAWGASTVQRSTARSRQASCDFWVECPSAHLPPPTSTPQWTQGLVKADLFHDAAKLTAALEELCLTTCAANASAALVALHRELGDLVVSDSGQSSAGPGLLRGCQQRVQQQVARAWRRARGRLTSCCTPPAPQPRTPQSHYTLGSSDAIPLTLAADMLRLAKLAKIAQVDVAVGVHHCCAANATGGIIPESGQQPGSPDGGAAAFTNFTGGALEEKISQAAVNVSSILSGLPPVLIVDDTAPEAPAVTKLAGRVINSGGLTNCKVGRQGCLVGGGMHSAGAPPPARAHTARLLAVIQPPASLPGCASGERLTPLDPPCPRRMRQGTYTPLATGVAEDLTTDGLGAFSVTRPQAARYQFGGTLPGAACRDALTNATVRVPLVVYLPPLNSTVVNAIALLTVPALSDAAVAARYPRANGLPTYLARHVYGMFGYSEAALGVRWGAGWGRGPGATITALRTPCVPAAAARCSRAATPGAALSRQTARLRRRFCVLPWPVTWPPHPTPGRLPAVRRRRADARQAHRRGGRRHLQPADGNLRVRPGDPAAASGHGRRRGRHWRRPCGRHVWRRQLQLGRNGRRERGAVEVTDAGGHPQGGVHAGGGRRQHRGSHPPPPAAPDRAAQRRRPRAAVHGRRQRACGARAVAQGGQ